MLHNEQSIGVSALSTAARMNQKRCNEHLKWLEERGYINILKKGRRKQIILTQAGFEAAKSILRALE